jgi:hypothetical protein
MKFYLGTHMYTWLYKKEVTMPLFLSNRVLRKLKKFKYPAQTNWALDSGGFSELSLFSEWVTTEKEYLKQVEKYTQELGSIDFISPQDWMCEPVMLKKTGLSIREHQKRTIRSVLSIRQSKFGHLVIPVLQGWVLDDYKRHIDMYTSAGIYLEQEPLVGIGSVCRRQSTQEIADLLKTLSKCNIKLHGFGVKKQGLIQSKQYLKSSDSMAWSLAGRYKQMEGCNGKNAANCYLFAKKWYDEIQSILDAD